MEQIVRLYHNSKVNLKVKLIFKIQNKYANGRATVEVTDIYISISFKLFYFTGYNSNALYLKCNLNWSSPLAVFSFPSVAS